MLAIRLPEAIEARARRNRKTIPLDDVERQLGLGR
jgi:hypothetical protein